jgi:hypothetical protein
VDEIRLGLSEVALLEQWLPSRNPNVLKDFSFVSSNEIGSLQKVERDRERERKKVRERK